MPEIRNFIRQLRCDMQVCLKYSGQRSPVHASAADVKVSLVDDPEGGQKVAFGQRRHVHQVDLSIWAGSERKENGGEISVIDGRKESKKQLCGRKTGWWLDYQKETRVPIKQQWTEPCRQADTRIRKVWQSADSVWLVRPAPLSRSSRWRSSAGSLWPWAPAGWPAEPCPEERQHTARSLPLPAVAFLTEGIVSPWYRRGEIARQHLCDIFMSLRLISQRGTLKL